MRGIHYAGSNASKSAAPPLMRKGSEVRFSTMSRINRFSPVYLTLTRSGTAGTGQYTQPAPNHRAKSNAYKHQTNIPDFLAANFSYKKIILVLGIHDDFLRIRKNDHLPHLWPDR